MNITVQMYQNSLIIYVQYLFLMSYNKTVDLLDVSYNNQGEILSSLINSVVITGIVNTNQWQDIVTTTPSIMH